MPSTNVRYVANQFGLPSVAGLNDQDGFWAVNNSAQPLAHGDVVVIDVSAAATTRSNTANGAQTLTQGSMTLNVTASTGFTSGIGYVNASVITGGAATPIAFSYTGTGAGTLTGVQGSIASITNGVATGATVWDQTANTNAAGAITGAALSGTTGDGGRFVCLSPTAGNPLVAGVVSLDGTAGTVTVGQMGNDVSGTAAVFAGLAGAPAIPPGGTVFVVTRGVARVQIGASTVAASALLRSDVIPRQAIGSGTVGNIFGIALESQANKDANNTIRALIKLA